jgi:Lon-like ATP-dependent protease
MGVKKVIIPKSNMMDVLIEESYREKIQIIPVETLEEVLEHVLIGGPKKKGLLEKLTAMVAKSRPSILPGPGDKLPGIG